MYLKKFKKAIDLETCGEAFCLYMGMGDDMFIQGTYYYC